jgi:hypothetical protein
VLLINRILDFEALTKRCQALFITYSAYVVAFSGARINPGGNWWVPSKKKTFNKTQFPFDPGIPDNAVVSIGELALALRISRWTIRHWRDDLKYEFEFGNRTTPGHAKAWMRANKHLLEAKERTPKKEDVGLNEKLASLKWGNWNATQGKPQAEAVKVQGKTGTLFVVREYSSVFIWNWKNSKTLLRKTSGSSSDVRVPTNPQG